MRLGRAMLAASAFSLRSEPRPALVTFDCTGTLFEPTASIGTLYGRAIVDAANAVGAPCGTWADADVLAPALDRAFGEAYTEQMGVAPCFGARDPRYVSSSREWWRAVVESTFTRAGVPSSVRLCDSAHALTSYLSRRSQLPHLAGNECRGRRCVPESVRRGLHCRRLEGHRRCCPDNLLAL